MYGACSMHGKMKSVCKTQSEDPKMRALSGIHGNRQKDKIKYMFLEIVWIEFIGFKIESSDGIL